MVNLFAQPVHKQNNVRPVAYPRTLHRLTNTIVDHVYQGMMMMDDRYYIIQATTAAEMLLDLPTGTLVGRNGRDLLGEETRHAVDLSAGQTHRYTTTLSREDTPAVPATVTIAAIDLDGRRYYQVSIAAVPQLEQLQSALTLGQRLAGLGMLTAGVAHELKNPLSVINVTCANMRYAISEEAPESTKLDRYTDMIENNIRRCARLVETLRTYAHAEPVQERADINQLVQQALSIIAEPIRRQDNLHIRTILAEELPSIVCDPSQITQVLLNLLTNAADAVRETGGTITIKTWDVLELDSVAVCVSDTGGGISDDHLDRVFDPFFTTKPRGEGMGLGLFIAAEVVRHHNGWLRAQNHLTDQMETAGAQFTVMLPTR